LLKKKAESTRPAKAMKSHFVVEDLEIPRPIYCAGILGGFRASAKLDSIVDDFKNKIPQDEKLLIASFFKGSLGLLEAIFHKSGEVRRGHWLGRARSTASTVQNASNVPGTFNDGSNRRYWSQPCVRQSRLVCRSILESNGDVSFNTIIFANKIRDLLLSLAMCMLSLHPAC
jgi:hypothetical protein